LNEWHLDAKRCDLPEIAKEALTFVADIKLYYQTEIWPHVTHRPGSLENKSSFSSFISKVRMREFERES